MGLNLSEIKVVLDFVPNHTSKNHAWWLASCNKKEEMEDFYIWRKESEINDWVGVRKN